MRQYNDYLGKQYVGLKTAKGAQARLDKLAAALDEGNALAVVVQGTDDGLFYPVVIINNKNEYLAGVCPHYGVWVTNG